MKLKLTRKGYLIISVVILILLTSGAIYAYISSQTVRDLVGKLTSQGSKAINNTPSPTPISSPVSNSSPTPIASPISTNMADAEIKSNILQGILKNPEWRKNEIETKVINGNVELKGFVGDIAQIPQVEQFVRSISGVKQVIVSLEVRPDPTTTSSPTPIATTSPENSSETLAKEVEFACYKTDAFEIKTMKFSVNDGQVTLSGKVRSRAEKLLAERVAKEVTGVKSVINDLEVK